MPPSHPPGELTIDARFGLDAICDDFEDLLRGGKEPRIEDFLRRVPELQRAHLFAHLLELERTYRRRDKASYLARFEEHEELIEEVYALRPEHEAPDPALITPANRPTRDTDWPAIPGYEILDKVDKGGMGLVYKARHLKFDCDVALKVMHAGWSATTEDRQRFLFEARTTRALKHPNIVTIHDVGEANGTVFLCLDYLENGSLADRMEKKPGYSATQVAALLHTIARAVQHAHDRGVLHRDLKPANILLADKEDPRVADFGLARQLRVEHGLTSQEGIAGTPEYMAPEQARPGEDLTVQTDVYGLGAILYELLTGAPPNEGSSVTQILDRLKNDPRVTRPRERNPAVPLDMEAICLKCLEPKPADRYASAAELADDLGRFGRGEAVSARPPGAWDWTIQVMRTRPERSPNYTWPAPVWCGGVLFAQYAAIAILAATNAPLGAVWAVALGGWAGCALIVWLLLLRRFRTVPATERHSIILAAGSLVAQVVLFLAAVPLSWEGPSGQVLPVYPPLVVVAGLGFFILGSTHWGQLIPVGLGTMALALVMAAWPWTGPPLYAAVVPLCLVWWGLAKWCYFVRPSGPGAAAGEGVFPPPNKYTTGGPTTTGESP